MSLLFRHNKSKVISSSDDKKENNVAATSSPAKVLNPLSKPPENVELSAAVVHPSYTKLSEGLRKKTPAGVICLAFCGGRKCRFDTNDRWSAEDMAIDGIFSHWFVYRKICYYR